MKIFNFLGVVCTVMQNIYCSYDNFEKLLLQCSLIPIYMTPSYVRNFFYLRDFDVSFCFYPWEFRSENWCKLSWMWHEQYNSKKKLWQWTWYFTIPATLFVPMIGAMHMYNVWGVCVCVCVCHLHIVFEHVCSSSIMYWYRAACSYIFVSGLFRKRCYVKRWDRAAYLFH